MSAEMDAIREHFRKLGLEGPTVAQAMQCVDALCDAGLLRTEAETADPGEHMHPDDPRYDGFRIREYWILTAVAPDNQEAPLLISPNAGAQYHLADGPAMAADQRRLGTCASTPRRWSTGSAPRPGNSASATSCPRERTRPTKREPSTACPPRYSGSTQARR